MAGYTKKGPFVNGTTPPMDAPFCNGLENWIIGVDAPTVATLNGATSGTAKIYQPLVGTTKYVVIQLNNFWNNGGSVQTIALPTAFTSMVKVRTESLFNIELRVGSTAQNIDIVTALNVSGIGNTTTQTLISAWSSGRCIAAVDTIGFRNGGSNAVNGLIILEGI